MRIFRVGSKSRKLRRQNSLASRQPPIESIPSIGSELAASDQFEIVVARRDHDGITGSNDQKRGGKSKYGFFSYFSSDNDDSTVSSITTVEYGGFFHSSSNGKRPYLIHNATNAAAASISSWCCCGDSDNTTSNTNTTNGGATRRTHPSSTDNTLIQHSAYGTLQPNDSRSQMYRSMSGGNSRYGGGIDGSISPIKRQRSFLFSSYYPWSRSNNTHQQHRNGKSKYLLNTNSSMKNVPNMSASLFDDLSEDELDILAKRSTSFSVGRRSKKYVPSPPPPSNIDQSQQKPVALRRVMTWKRKVF